MREKQGQEQHGFVCPTYKIWHSPKIHDRSRLRKGTAREKTPGSPCAKGGLANDMHLFPKGRVVQKTSGFIAVKKRTGRAKTRGFIAAKKDGSRKNPGLCGSGKYPRFMRSTKGQVAQKPTVYITEKRMGREKNRGFCGS